MSDCSSATWIFVFALALGGGMTSVVTAKRPANQNNDIYVIQRSGAQIVAVSGFLNCDSLMCPWLSIFCYVQRDSLDTDLSRVRRLRVCMKRNGEQAKVMIDEPKNPTPGQEFHDKMKNYE